MVRHPKGVRQNNSAQSNQNSPTLLMLCMSYPIVKTIAIQRIPLQVHLFPNSIIAVAFEFQIFASL